MIAYLTGDDSGGVKLCRRFRIPVELLPALFGQLEELTYSGHYEQHGDLTPQQMADLAADMLLAYTQSGDNCMIGTIVHYLTENPPTGVLPLDGQTYSGDDYPDLYSVLDSTFKDGNGNFTLPDARSRSLVGTGSGAGGLSLYALGDTFGTETHSLSVNELPAHTHGEQDPGIVQVQSGLGAFALSDPGLPSQTGSTGGDEAHENRPPSLAVHIGVWYQ